MLTMAGPGPLEHLTGEFGWGAVTLRFEHCTTPPPAAELAGVHLVPFVSSGEVVLARVDDPAKDDAWIVPGGTIEPGETWQATAARELLEEAGARLVDITPFGIMRLHDAGDERYREHLPWPDCCWVVAHAEVEIIGPPTTTDTAGNAAAAAAERIAEVRVTTVAEAARLLERNDAPAWADAYRLGGWLRANSCAKPCRETAATRPTT